MRLTVLASEFPPGPGGIGTHAWEISRRLVLCGWDCRVLAAQDYAADEEISEFNSRQPLPVVRLDSCKGPIANLAGRWKAIRRELAHFNPDVVLASGQRAAWLAALACRHPRRPWLAVGHGTEFRSDPRWSAAMTRWAFSQATAVVAVSEFTRGLMQRAGVRPHAVHVIPNGADADRFRPLPQEASDVWRDRYHLRSAKVILTVGNVTPRKGQETIVRAMPQILERVPDAHYVMVGLPTIKERLLELAQRLGVQHRMHFPGRVSADDLVQWHNACDVFAMTSHSTDDGDCEGYGIAVVEAALCGKPSVVSGDCGLVEAVQADETAFVVPQGDAAAAAQAITTLLRSDQLRASMGRAARCRAVEQQTWQKRVREYDAILRQAVSNRYEPRARFLTPCPAPQPSAIHDAAVSEPSES